MRRWLLINTGGDRLDDLGLVSVVAFTSGDGDAPMDGDLQEAALELAKRRDIPPTATNLEVLLVPLDDGRRTTFSIDLTASVVSHGGVV